MKLRRSSFNPPVMFSQLSSRFGDLWLVGGRGSSSTTVLLLIMTLVGLAACGPSRSLERPQRGVDSRSWHRDTALWSLLDDVTASRSTEGNRVALLPNGEVAYPRRYTNMEGAKVVLVKTFVFTEDESGRAMADRLAQLAADGALVVLQYDVKGSIGDAEDVEEMLDEAHLDRPLGEKRIIAAMRSAGVIVVPTNDPGRGVARREWVSNLRRLVTDTQLAAERSLETLMVMNHADHEKLFVTIDGDGTVRAIVGGLNIASEYAFGGVEGRVDATSGQTGWRDTDVEVMGPAALNILDDYIADYERVMGEGLPGQLRARIDGLVRKPTKVGDARVRFVANHPMSDHTFYTEDAYRVLLQATPVGEPIFLATPYFAPSKILRDAIIEHAQLGGHVTILTNSPESTDIEVLADAAYFTAHAILSETDNVSFYTWIPRPDEGEHTLHHKIASFGRHGPVIVGSFNLDAQSSMHNTEDLVIIDDVSLRDDFDAMVARDLSPGHAQQVTLKDLQSAPIQDRVKRVLIHELAWYWL